MANRLFRRLRDDLFFINRKQVRCGHWLRGKPPTTARNLEQRLAEINYKDPQTSYRVDIGYKQPQFSRKKVMSSWIDHLKKLRSDPIMEKKAREIQLKIDLDQVRDEWSTLNGPGQIRTIAEYYGVFEHLFGDAYFTPVISLNIDYAVNDDLAAVVSRGNLMKPSETAEAPRVQYDAAEDSLWSLLLTTPDGNFVDSEKELCHWFIGNIPGNAVSKGDLLFDYMRPIPARGLGYCRYVFVLYKQNERIDYSGYKKSQPCLELTARSWSTYDFYINYQDKITPAGLAFFQADWDDSLTEFYRHSLNTQEPVFEYDFPEPHIRKQKWFPKGQPFNLYLDKYRDPKDINKDFLMKKMQHVHPFRPMPPPLKYPNAQIDKSYVPSWLRLERKKERLGWGRINEIA